MIPPSTLTRPRNLHLHLHIRSLVSSHGHPVRPSASAATVLFAPSSSPSSSPSSPSSPSPLQKCSRYHSQRRHASGPSTRSGLANGARGDHSRPAGIPPIWFNSSPPVSNVSSGRGEDGEHKAPDERTLKLGKTIRILHTRLPTLLASPLPQEILSPHISLHLFPSTHPHLPTVTGRVAYTAALWTAPVAWGRVPIVGNVRLQIVSERMFKSADSASASSTGDAGSGNEGLGGADGATTTTTAATGNEKLLVRWKTCASSSSSSSSSSSATDTFTSSSPTSPLTSLLHSTSSSSSESSAKKDKDNEFTGLFIFTFDGDGRIATHTIEHAERRDGSDHDRMGAVVSVTDWLLGRARWRHAREGEEMGWAFCAGAGAGAPAHTNHGVWGGPGSGRRRG
ncbi:MAG: hypothetical protein M1819_005173 [Sarea resinae]|nr:MAG: hypothetical protein M1819_005173 [Sarea resinae]